MFVTLLVLAAYSLHGTAHHASAVQASPGVLNAMQRLNSSLYLPSAPPPARSSGTFRGSMTVMVGLELRNQSGLDSFLREVSNPSSSMYGHYLTRKAFASRFSPSIQLYDEALAYFHGYSGLVVTGYSDRLSISVTGNASSMGTAFHTTVSDYSSQGKQYYSAGDPGLPYWLECNLCYVNGLENFSKPSATVGGGIIKTSSSGDIPYSNGYPLPIGGNPGPQLVWGSDMQKAYNVSGIINSTSLNNTVVATIFWTNGTAPFYPADVQNYFNQTLPSWEKKPRVVPVPLDGAMMPGISAQNDTSGSALENTLDIEMAGSMSPGATIYNVYTPFNSYSELDQSLAYILNPGNSSSGLNNVSVISNSWYSTDRPDPIWTQSVDEAAARGITILACSGDSGDNITSPKDIGTNAAFPGTASNDTAGVVSVGGTTVTLNTAGGQGSFLSLSSQSAWFSNPNTEGNSGPIGTQGGISQFYGEPSWQLNSTANTLLNGKGRGVPDISAVANYMLMFLTVSGTSYYDNPQYYYAWGTSVATPIMAGLIADVNAYLVANNHNMVGFIDPLLYNLSNVQYSYRGVSPAAFPGYYNAFHDVVNGSNSKYAAGKGYDLATGLGSINAGNLVHDILSNITYEYVPNNSTNSTGMFSLDNYNLVGGGLLTIVILATAGVALRKRYRRGRDGL